MRPITTPLLIVLLSTIALPVLAQRNAEDTRLDHSHGFAHSARKPHLANPAQSDPFQFILDRGIHIEDHPNGYDLYAAKALALTATCPTDTALPCGRILSSLRFPFVTGAMYHAAVPARVNLRGGADELWWEPTLHCVTHDTQRRSRYKVSSGPTCTNIVDSETQQMEWLIGGRLAGGGPDKPGLYEGWIPVTITMGSQTWVVDTAVTYRLHAPEKVCQLEAGVGNITISGLPIEVGEAEPGGKVDIQPTTSTNTALELGGNFSTLCGEDGTDSGCPTTITAQTGWVRIMAASSDTWSLDVEAVTLEVTTGSEGHGSDAAWTWHVGYFDAGGRGVRIDTFRSGSISDADSPYFDSGNVAHIFLGGHVTIPNNWEPHRAGYSGSAVVSLTCS